MRPASAIQVRADEVKPGDHLVVDGEVLGEVGRSFAASGYNDLHGIGSLGGEWFVYRASYERVWVVRAPELHEITVQLTEEQIRKRAEWLPCYGAVSSQDVRAFASACVEWVANHPEPQTAASRVAMRNADIDAADEDD